MKGLVQHHLKILPSDGEKGEKLFFQLSQFWTKQLETANIILSCSRGRLPPCFSLALTFEGPGAPTTQKYQHSQLLLVWTPSCSIFGQTNLRDVFAFLTDLANLIPIY